MRVLIAYDINTESEGGSTRLRKVAKRCESYGVRVQNSLFECIVNGAQLETLKNSLYSIINKNLDSIIIYHLPEKAKTEHLGIVQHINMKEDVLII